MTTINDIAKKAGVAKSTVSNVFSKKKYVSPEICERVMCKVKPGSIILNHNNSDHVLDALPLMLERLKNKGYKVVSVGELIYDSDYYIDNLGIQRKN